MTTTSDVWSAATGQLSRDYSTGLNTAVEACERWTGDRSKLAMIIRHANGERESLTYYDLAKQSAQVTEVLKRTGLKRGDRVAGVLSRQREAWLTALAAWRAGIVYVPIFTGFGSDAVAQRLSEANVTTVVVDYRSRAVVNEALSQINRDIAVVCVAGPRGVGMMRDDWSFWSEVDRVITVSEAVATSASETATLMFTSGTTSTPKSCLIPHDGFVSLIPFVRAVMDLQPSDLLFSTSDSGWSYGLYTSGVAPMSLGFPRLIYAGDFSPRDWLEIIDDEDVSFVAGAPSAFRGLARYAASYHVAETLRGATCAGEALDEDTASAWGAMGRGTLLDGYGLTEVGMVLANFANQASPPIPGTLTGPVPGFEVELHDEDGRPATPGEIGQIVVRRPPFQLSIGYDNQASAWEERWCDDWFMTADLARIDEAGHWHYVGREDDVIVTSGYNVGPAEIEAALLQHSGVAEAAAVAMPDPERGHIVRVFVVRAVGAPPDEKLTKELQDIVRARVGRHAYPRIIEYVESLPRTVTGKLRRAVLREASKPE
jgi:acetyl-CoA synthetase